MNNTCIINKQIKPHLMTSIKRVKDPKDTYNKDTSFMGAPEKESSCGQPGLGSAKKTTKLNRLKLKPQNDSERELCAKIEKKAHQIKTIIS